MQRSLLLYLSVIWITVTDADISPPDSCPPGTAYKSDYFACLPCPIGYYCPGGSPATSATSILCPTGFVSITEGNALCTPCPPGTVQITNGQYISYCQPCPIGTYQPNYNASATNLYTLARCKACPDGKFADKRGSASCDGVIPYGIMHTLPNQFNVKLRGDTSALGYQNSNASCFAGWHCGEGEDRYLCPAGTYSPQGSSECTPCPPGSQSLSAGSASCSPPCRFKYVDTTGSNSTDDCQNCPTGTAVLDYGYGAANIYNLKTPLLTSNECRKVCSTSGTVLDGTNCVYCSANTAAVYLYYNPNSPAAYISTLSYDGMSIQTWNGTCQSECPPGTFLATSTSGGQTAYWCDVCYGGNFYCPGGVVNYGTMAPATQQCPTGRRAGLAAKSVDDCYEPSCTSNGQCYHDGSSTCEVRKPGYSYTKFFDKPVCYPCANGTGTSLTPGTDPCVPAPKGKGWITNTTFGDCPSGHSCPIAEIQPYGSTIIAAYVPPITCGPNEIPSPDKTKCMPQICPLGTSYDATYSVCSKYNSDISISCFIDSLNSYTRHCPGGNISANTAFMTYDCFGNNEVPSTGGGPCVSESCEPGYYKGDLFGVQAPYIINGSECRKCPDVEHLYCTGGTALPSICSMNFTQSYGGQQGIVTPNRTNCVCPPGAEPKQYTNKCYYKVTSCAIGKYVDTFQNSCADCPNNFMCPDGINRQLCGTGTVSAPNKTVCIPGNNNNNNNNGCSGMPPTCTAPQVLACMNNQFTCVSNAPLTCTGDPGNCNGRTSCTANGNPLTCTVYPVCNPGEYLQSTSPTLDTVCRTGSTSCPSGQYLQVTGTGSPLSFSCVACPSGYTCAGGIGSIPLSTTEYSFSPMNPPVCTSPATMMVTEFVAGAYPVTPVKYRCGLRQPTVYGPLTAPIMSCPAGMLSMGITCLPCPVGAATCQGGFRVFNVFNGNAPAPAPSASSTPSNTPTPSSTASSAPPAQQDVLIPYLLSSPDVCAKSGIANKFLDPTTGIAVNLRYSMATSLGYNGSAAFVSGLVLCDSTYIPIGKDAAINTVNADQPFNTSDTPRRRRLYDMLNSLSLPIDGTTVVVELGVSVPAILAPALTNLMVAMITNASAADIQALATNITTIMASSQYLAMFPAQSGPNVAVSIPSSLATVITTAAGSGNVPTFTASLGTVGTAAITPLFTALNIPLTNANVTTSVFSSGIRAGSTVTFANNNNGGGSAPSDGTSSSGSGTGALGALVLIPIAFGICCFIVWYRRRKEEEEKKNGTKGSKSVEENFTDVTGTSTNGKNSEFEVKNPNLLVRRTVVEVKLNTDTNTSTTGGSVV